MRIVVCGQKSFGAAVVAALDELHDVAVFSPPTHSSGLTDRTAAEASKRGLSWSPSGTLRPEWLRETETDLIVGAHSHDFIGRKSRQATTYGAIGFHPSLLPRHRGRDAVRWTIKMGDPIAGGTVYVMTDNVDAGPIVLQKFIHVHPDWDHSDLWNALFPLGVEMLKLACQWIQLPQLELLKQDEAAATWEPSWEREPMWRPELLELTP